MLVQGIQDPATCWHHRSALGDVTAYHSVWTESGSIPYDDTVGDNHPDPEPHVAAEDRSVPDGSISPADVDSLADPAVIADDSLLTHDDGGLVDDPYSAANMRGGMEFDAVAHDYTFLEASR